MKLMSTGLEVESINCILFFHKKIEKNEEGWYISLVGISISRPGDINFTVTKTVMFTQTRVPTKQSL